MVNKWQVLCCAQIAEKFLSSGSEEFEEADIVHAPKLMEVPDLDQK